MYVGYNAFYKILHSDLYVEYNYEDFLNNNIHGLGTFFDQRVLSNCIDKQIQKYLGLSEDFTYAMSTNWNVWADQMYDFLTQHKFHDYDLSPEMIEWYPTDIQTKWTNIQDLFIFKNWYFKYIRYI